MVGVVPQVVACPAISKARRVDMWDLTLRSELEYAFTHPPSRGLVSRRDISSGEAEVDEHVTKLIRLYQPFCRSVAFKIVQDPDATEDVLQNALVRIWLAFRRYPPEQREILRVQSWLSRIVANEARKYLASNHKLVRLESEEEQWEDELEGPGHDQPEVAVEEEEKELLGRLLSLLPARSTYRDIIEKWLHFCGSYEDLARAYSCDIRTIRTRFHRAVQCLRDIVREQHIRESDLRGWLQAYRLVLEKAWGVEQRAFSLRDYINGEAYANTFWGYPIRGQREAEDPYIPDEFLPPSYWN